MSTIICGIPFRFNVRKSWDIQPGSVPGPGGLFDEYTCEGCGWRVMDRVFGSFHIGEREMMEQQLLQTLKNHQNYCPKLKEGGA